MSKTSSHQKNFRLICPSHKSCAKTVSLTKQRPSSPFCVAITSFEIDPDAAEDTPAQQHGKQLDSSPAIGSLPHRQRAEQAADKQNARAPQSQKKAVLARKAGAAKTCRCCYQTADAQPDPLDRPDGKPAAAHPPGKRCQHRRSHHCRTQTACRYCPHPSFAAVLRRSAPVYPLRCWAILVVQHFFHKKSPHILSRLSYRIFGEKFFYSLSGSLLLIFFVCCPLRRLAASAVVLLFHKKTPRTLCSFYRMRGEAF